MTVKLLYYPNKTLLKPCEPVKVEDLDKLRPILKEMESILFKEKGRGLAACQVGIPLNMFICLLGADTPQVFINPEISEKSKEQIPSIEGCLSIPDIDVRLNCRYKQVRVKALDEDGQEFSLLLENYNSVILQHEFDHCHGITLFQRMKSAQRELKRNQYRKLMKRRRKHEKGK